MCFFGVASCLLVRKNCFPLQAFHVPHPDSSPATVCFDSKGIWKRLQLRRRIRGSPENTPSQMTLGHREAEHSLSKINRFQTGCSMSMPESTLDVTSRWVTCVAEIMMGHTWDLLSWSAGLTSAVAPSPGWARWVTEPAGSWIGDWGSGSNHSREARRKGKYGALQTYIVEENRIFWSRTSWSILSVVYGSAFDAGPHLTYNYL